MFERAIQVGPGASLILDEMDGEVTIGTWEEESATPAEKRRPGSAPGQGKNPLPWYRRRRRARSVATWF